MGDARLRITDSGAGFDAAFDSLPARIYGRPSRDAIPDGARRLLALRGDAPVARCTFRIVRGLYRCPPCCGVIGHYEAADAAAGVALLRRAAAELAARGAARIVGPMNGSTWESYRVALPGGAGDPRFDPPLFFTEPHNPPGYAGHFEAAGFAVAARYESRIDVGPRVERPGAYRLRDRVHRSGIRLRPFDLSRYDEDLEAVFDLTRAAFARSLYYAPIDFGRFRALYEPLTPAVDPDLILLAEDPEADLLGFLFAYPDLLSGAGGRADRVVAKTLATAPAARHLGLGTHIVDEFRRVAGEKGYQAVIHAAMHVSNDSLRISTRYGSQIFRRYALFEAAP